MKVQVHRYLLQLKQPFRISHGTYYTRECCIIELCNGDFIGYGEMTGIDYYGWTIDDAVKALEVKKNKIEQLIIEDPRNTHTRITSLFPDLPHLVSALDCALWDMYGRAKDKSVSELLGIPRKSGLLSSYTLSYSENFLNQLQAFSWPIAKIKLGTAQDVETLEVLARAQLDFPIRIDANEGWTRHAFQVHAPMYHVLQYLLPRIEMIEQPFPHNTHIQEQKNIDTSIPIFADESCKNNDDIAMCAEYFDGVNVKLMKAGGISEAYKMMHSARQSGLSIMCGCMTETTIGISAMAQLASLCDFIDLDGSALIKNDPASGVRIMDGEISYNNLPGIGVELLR